MGFRTNPLEAPAPNLHHALRPLNDIIVLLQVVVQGVFNDLEKVNNLKPFFWLAIIILIIFFMVSHLVHFDIKL